MARSDKLTPEVQDKIANLVRAGHYLETAAGAAGIAPSTFHDWMKKGREAKEAGKGGKHRQFYDAIKEAEAQSELLLVDKIVREGGAKGALQILKRRFRDRWGDKVTNELTGPGGKELPTAGPAVQVVISGQDGVWNPQANPVEEASEEDIAGEDDL